MRHQLKGINEGENEGERERERHVRIKMKGRDEGKEVSSMRGKRGKKGENKR